MSTCPLDLYVLVADLQAEMAIKGLLARRQSLGLRPFSSRVERHPKHDSGCCRTGVSWLRETTPRPVHAMIVFDHEGSGREAERPEDVEIELEKLLKATMLFDDAGVIVISPELEAWVWSDSPLVDGCLGWSGQDLRVRAWLEREGLWPPDQPKPVRPKEAMERALRQSGKRRSAAIFSDLASRVGLDRCSDRAFVKLKSKLREWFGVGTA